jgi:hypothetical protein
MRDRINKVEDGAISPIVRGRDLALVIEETVRESMFGVLDSEKAEHHSDHHG